MLSPFGIIRFSCSLLIHCFVKSKRRRRRSSNRRLGGADEDVIALPPPAVSAAKNAIAKVAIHVKPLRPVGKPCLASFLSFFLNNKPIQQPVIQSICSDTNTEQQIDEVQQSWGDFDLESRSSGMESVGSLGSLSSDDERESSEASDSDAESFEFGELCPRTSSETSSTRKGFNPTFYGVDVSDEEDPDLLQKSAEFRRLNSIVERDARLKENAHKQTQQLLLNPAYGDVTREESDLGDSDVQTETKLKTLKSLAAAGCLALPASTALVGSEYIGRTSLNPTYGDISTSSSSEDDCDLTSNDSLPISSISPFEQRPVCDLERLHRLDGISPRSLPMSSFREMADSGISENMGTLTWSNVVYSHSEKSEEQTSHRDLQHRWREILCTDAAEEVPSPLRPSPFADPSTGLQALHFRFENEASCELPQLPHIRVNKTLVTPVQPMHDGFEDINLKCPPIQHMPPTRHLKQRISVSSPKGCSNFLTSGMKHTRGLLRWIYVLLVRIDGYLTNKKN